MLLGLSATLNRGAIPDELIIQIGEYARKEIESIERCKHCNHWRVCTETYCHSCFLGEASDTDNSEDFESADGVGENGNVVEKGGWS